MVDIKKAIKKNWKKYLQIVSDASDILVHIKSKPTLIDYTSIGLKIFNSYSKYKSKDLNPFEDGSGKWEYYDFGRIGDFIFSLIVGCVPHELLEPSDNDHNKYYKCTLNNTFVGFIDMDSNKEGGWFIKEEFNIALSQISDVIWNNMNTNYLVLSSKPSRFYTYELYIKPEENWDILPSKTAQQIYERILSFQSHNINRSIMLHGPPGTGKSVALRYISNKLNKKTLRIPVSKLDELDLEDLSIVINILNPEVLIIDDFDRLKYSEKFLNDLENINKKIKVFLVSVNNVEDFDGAIIRPGRFDDIIDFVYLESEIYEKLIGEDVPKNIRDRLMKLPISYISDFHKRKKVFGAKKAIDEIENLENRIKDLIKEYEE